MIKLGWIHLQHSQVMHDSCHRIKVQVALGLLLLFVCLIAKSAEPSPPQWWVEQSLITNSQPQNNAPLTIGQLKNTVWSVAKSLDAQFLALGGAGDELRAMVRAWDRNFPVTPNSAPHTPDIIKDGDMLAVANQGQLKNSVMTVYRRLKALGLNIVLKDLDAVTKTPKDFVVDPDHAASLPWSSLKPAKNSAPALLGHLKFCFSFELQGGLTGNASAGQVVAVSRDTLLPVTVPAGLNEVVAIAAGSAHNLALKKNGTVVAWGSNQSGATTVPAGLSQVVAISTQSSHNLALKYDGTVVAWGDNNSGQQNIPPGLNEVVAISAGRWHNLALKSNGTVVAWGSNDRGQSAVPTGLNNVVLISAGSGHSIAIKADGTVVGWGDNAYAQLSMGNAAAVSALSSTGNRNLLLRKDGTAFTNGGYFLMNQVPFGLLTLFDWSQRSPAELNNAVAISSSGDLNIALRNDGTTISWKHVVNPQASYYISNYYYYISNGYPIPSLNAYDLNIQPVFQGLTNLIAVDLGGTHLAIVGDGVSPVWHGESYSLGAEGDVSTGGVYYRPRIQNGPLSFSASGLPPGLSIAPSTGIVSGTATTTGVWTATISARNDRGFTSKSVRFYLD